MSKPVLGALVLAAALSGLTACSSDADPAPAIELGDDASSSAPSSPAPASPSASPTKPPRFGDRTQGEAEVVVGEIAPTGKQERLAADALVRYMRVRLDSYNQASVDIAELAQVAIGDAVTQVSSYVAGLQERKQHTVGTLTVNVGKVSVAGKRAKVASCMLNTTADADRRNRIVETEVSPAYDVTATALRVAPSTWLIEDISFVYVTGCR